MRKRQYLSNKTEKIWRVKTKTPKKLFSVAKYNFDDGLFSCQKIWIVISKVKIANDVL